MAEKNESILWVFKIAKTHFSKWRVLEARSLRCRSQGAVLWEGWERFYFTQCGVAVRILGCGLTSLVFFPFLLRGILPCTCVPKLPSRVNASHRPGVCDTQDSLCQPALLLGVEWEVSP